MLFFENLKIALDSIFANKMRSFLTMLGIIIGVAAVIAITSVGQGAVQRINTYFTSLGATTITLTASPTEGDEELIHPDDVDAIRESIAEVEYVTPNETELGELSSEFGEHPGLVSYGNADLRFVDLAMGSDLNYGRYFSDQDYQEGRNVAVVSEDTANILFNGRDDVVGESLQLQMNGESQSFVIIGVVPGYFEEMIGQFDVSQLPVNIAVPSTALRNAGMIEGPQTQLAIQTETVEDIEPVSQQIVRMMELRHGVVGEDQYTAYNTLQSLDTLEDILNLFINFIAAVAGIALFVGGIGIMNIMLVSVTERTREIGIRKALGARVNTILSQFLMESVILSVLGGLIGIVLGALISFAVGSAIDIVPAFQLSTIIFIVVFTAAIGIIFGVYPARKAANLDPIEALSYE